MGSGASKKLQIVEAPAYVTPFSSHQEYPVHITLQPRIPQEKWLSRDREDESCGESSSQEDVEWNVSHTGTLRRYKINYPEQGEDFQKVFENMQVLRNTMTNSSTINDRYSKDVETAILNLLAISPSLLLIDPKVSKIQPFENAEIYKEKLSLINTKLVNPGVLFLTMWINSC